MKKKFIIIFTISFLFGFSSCTSLNNNLKLTTPDERFVDNNDGTIVDKKTNLMWKKCSEGLSGKNCASGDADTYTWEEAKKKAKNTKFAGYSNWRLPTIKELVSIIERAKHKPAINQNFFPNTIYYNCYWSLTVYAKQTNRAWLLDFRDGTILWGHKNYYGYVRLVRSLQ